MGGLTAPQRPGGSGRRPPRFTLRAEAPAATAPGWAAPAGSTPWTPAARLLTLRAAPGAMVACRLVLERAGDWSDEEAGEVAVAVGAFAGAGGVAAVEVTPAAPRRAGVAVAVDLAFAVPTHAMPGRYKAPAEVRCGARREPLAIMLDIVEPG